MHIINYVHTMVKTKLFAAVLALFFVASCGKNTLTSLSGTKWGTTIQQITILLTFTDDSKGTIRVSNPAEGFDETLGFTYTFTTPNVVIYPTDPEYAAEFPAGLKATVHGNVLSFKQFVLGEEISLVKKK